MTKEKFLQIASIAFNDNEQLALSLLKSEIGDFIGVNYSKLFHHTEEYHQCSVLAYLCHAYANNYVDDPEMEFNRSDNLTEKEKEIMTTVEIPIPVSGNKINRYMHTVCNDVKFVFKNEITNS